MKLLRLLALVVAAAFLLLLIVGFDGLLGLLRYRVALFLVIGPVFVLFIWCIYKAFRAPHRLPDRADRDKKSI